MPYLRATPVAAAEGAAFLEFTVTLDQASSNEVKVNDDTVNGSATYNGSAPDFQRHYGTLVFAPGETTKLLAAPLVISNSAEGSETFTLDLSSPVNATVPQRSTGATILDPDSGFKVYSYGLSDDLYTVTNAQDRIAESALGGIDTAVFSGPRAAYTPSGTTTQRTVSGGADGSDTLFSLERLQFADTLLSSNTTPGGHVYQAYALLNAAFNRGPNTAELSQWTATLDRLGSLEDTATAFINAYAPGVPDDVLALYSGLLAIGSYTQGGLFALASSPDFNTVEIASIVGQTVALDPGFFPVPG